MLTPLNFAEFIRISLDVGQNLLRFCRNFLSEAGFCRNSPNLNHEGGITAPGRFREPSHTSSNSCTKLANSCARPVQTGRSPRSSQLAEGGRRGRRRKLRGGIALRRGEGLLPLGPQPRRSVSNLVGRNKVCQNKMHIFAEMITN